MASGKAKGQRQRSAPRSATDPSPGPQCPSCAWPRSWGHGLLGMGLEAPQPPWISAGPSASPGLSPASHDPLPDPRSPFPKHTRGGCSRGASGPGGLHQAPRANPKLGGNSNTEPPARHRAAYFDGGSAWQGSGALFLGLSPARPHPGWRQEPRGAPARGTAQPIFIRHHFPAAPPRPKPPCLGPEHTQGHVRGHGRAPRDVPAE